MDPALEWNNPGFGPIKMGPEEAGEGDAVVTGRAAGGVPIDIGDVVGREDVGKSGVEIGSSGVDEPKAGGVAAESGIAMLPDRGESGAVMLPDRGETMVPLGGLKIGAALDRDSGTKGPGGVPGKDPEEDSEKGAGTVNCDPPLRRGPGGEPL